MDITINPQTDALVVIDIQNDFCDEGALAVAGGQEIVPGVVDLAGKFTTVILTQDHHPRGHSSFASTHGQAPFSTAQMPYGEQVLWPDHCVQGTEGAQFHPDLEDMAVAPGTARETSIMDMAAAIVRKGTNPEVDSYSAFFENDQVTATGLGGFLAERGIKRVFCVGLAYDFCVGFSALDARRLGLEAVVVRDLTRAIGMPLAQGSTIDAIERKFGKAGVAVVDAAQIKTSPDRSGPGLR